MINLDLYLVPRQSIQHQVPQPGETWIVQSFIPRYAQLITKFPFDMWKYRIAKIEEDNKYYDSGSYPYSPNNENKCGYWGSSKSPSNCFDCRLIPIWDELNKHQKDALKKHGAIFSIHPVYEPDYYGSKKITFRVTKHPFPYLSIKNLGRYFRFEEDKDDYITFFIKNPERLKNIEGLQLITSQWIPD